MLVKLYSQQNEAYPFYFNTYTTLVFSFVQSSCPTYTLQISGDKVHPCPIPFIMFTSLTLCSTPIPATWLLYSSYTMLFSLYLIPTISSISNILFQLTLSRAFSRSIRILYMCCFPFPHFFHDQPQR